MRIGLMLRALDEKFGIGIYTAYIVDSLLEQGRDHQYILFYRSAEHLGRWAHHVNVEERVLQAPHRILWDQVAVPLAARTADVDVIFHTKFTVPLLTRRKTVMVLHGSSWFFHPEFFSRLDIAYVKVAMPLYCKRADAIISNSDLTKRDFVRVLGVPEEKIETITHGLVPRFKEIDDESVLQEARRRYGLPDRFVLTVGRYTARKNFETTLRAIAKSRYRGELKLVAVGDFAGHPKLAALIDELGLQEDVVFPGYVDQADLPAIYNLAETYLFPSLYEELGLPLVEAMACGCPIVASNVAAIPEIAGDAGILVEPLDAEAMAAGIDRLAEEPDYRAELVARGLRRVTQFTYERAARRTLDVLERAVQN